MRSNASPRSTNSAAPSGSSTTSWGPRFRTTTLNCQFGGNMNRESRRTLTSPAVRSWVRNNSMLSDIGTPLRSRSWTWYVPADERIRVTGPSNTRTRSIGSSPDGSNRKSTEAERPTDARSARGVARAPMNSTSRTSAWDRIVPLNSRCCTSSHVTHEARSGPTTRSSRGPIPWSGDARYASTNSTTVCRAAEASSAGPGASCDGAIGAAGPTGSRAHAASASAVTTTRAARARMDAPMIRPGGVPILGAEEPAGRPRVATLEERPDSAGQGAG